MRSFLRWAVGLWRRFESGLGALLAEEAEDISDYFALRR